MRATMTLCSLLAVITLVNATATEVARADQLEFLRVIGNLSAGRINAEAAAAKAQAEVIKAQAAVVQAEGEWAVKTAEARRKDAETETKRLENERLTAETFWEKRNMWQLNRNHPPAISPGDAVRLASQGRPRPLDTETWPHRLTLPPFAEVKAQLKVDLAARTEHNSGLGSENCHRIHAAVAEMEDLLKENVHHMPPMEYVHARRFLESLRHEATRPLSESPSVDALTDSRITPAGRAQDPSPAVAPNLDQRVLAVASELKPVSMPDIDHEADAPAMAAPSLTAVSTSLARWSSASTSAE